jgi:hypothetical protein
MLNDHILHGIINGSRIIALSVLAVGGFISPPAEAQAAYITISSTGLPEQIVPATAPFGGGYLIADATDNALLTVGLNGGAATVFAQTGFDTLALANLGSYYGPALTGQLLVAGRTGNGIGPGSTDVVAINQSGVITNLSAATASLVNGPAAGPQINNAAVAPQGGFGSIAAGQVVVTNVYGGINALSADGQSFSTFATLPVNSALGTPRSAWGVAFANSQMFVDDAQSGNLYSVNTQGVVSLLTTLPVPAGTVGGGRQMAVAPAGFGNYGGDLFVSISGSSGGGGTFGAIDVVDPSTGALIATYNQGSTANPLDPRGLLFTTIDGQSILLAANADPDIDLVPPQSFTAVAPPAAAPEIDPTSAATAITLLLGSLLVLTSRPTRGQRAAPAG